MNLLLFLTPRAFFSILLTILGSISQATIASELQQQNAARPVAGAHDLEHGKNKKKFHIYTIKFGGKATRASLLE